MSRQNVGCNDTSAFISSLFARLVTVETTLSTVQTSLATNLASNTTTGAVGIGTSTPLAKLNVKNANTSICTGTASVTVGSDAMQSDTVTFRADAAGDLNNTYWYLQSAQNATTYVVWYNVNGAGSNPYPGTATAAGSTTSIAVVVPTGETAINVAIATRAAILAAAPADFTIPATVTSTITVNYIASGWATVPTDGNVGGLWATAQVTAGQAGSDVVGVGTTFVADFLAGNAFSINNEVHTVVRVISATRLVIDSDFSATVSGGTVRKDITALQIDTSDGSTMFTIGTNGWLGLGTNAPLAALHIVGTTTATSSSAFSQFSSDIDAPTVALVKARGTEAAPSAVLIGDEIGRIQYSGYGATQNGIAGGVLMTASENWTDADNGASINFQTTTIGTNSPTEKMRLTDSGALFINQTIVTPDINGSFYVNAAANFVREAAPGSIRLGRINTTFAAPTGINNTDILGRIQVAGYDDANSVIGASIEFVATELWASATTSMGTDMLFYTAPNGGGASVEHMRISNGGLVGFGTSTPFTRIHVAGDTDVTTSVLCAKYGANNTGSLYGAYKARGTEATPTAVAGYDVLGQLQFTGRGATGDFLGLQVLARTTEAWSDVAQGTEVVFNTTLTGATGSAERMKINGGGQLLINRGTIAAPAYSFTDATNSGMSFDRGRLRFSWNGISQMSISSTDIVSAVPVVLPSHDVAALPAVGTAGGMIFVTGATGGAVLAFSDGVNWRRCNNRKVIS